MTGIDTNILVDLMVKSSPFHQKSTSEINNLDDSLCTTPTNIGEILRLITHPKVFPNPLTFEKAVDSLDQLLDYFKIEILEESRDWWKLLQPIANDIPGLRGNEIFDARIAICLKEHNVKKLITRDADFKKYDFLKPIMIKK